MSDRDLMATSEIAAAKAQTESFRERLAARRQKRNQLIAAATNSALPLNISSSSNVAALLAQINPQEPSKILVPPAIPKSPPSLIKQPDEGITIFQCLSFSSLRYNGFFVVS